MLCGILGMSRRDHMRNEAILHLSPIDEVMRSGRLCWFGHIKGRYVNNVTPRLVDQVQRMMMPQEDMAPTHDGRHDGRGCYPGCGPRQEGVEKKDKPNP